MDLTSAFTVDYWVKPEKTDAEFTFTPLVGKGGTRADGFKKRQYWFYLESGEHVNLPGDHFVQTLGIANANRAVEHFHGKTFTVDGEFHHSAQHLMAPQFGFIGMVPSWHGTPLEDPWFLIQTRLFASHPAVLEPPLMKSKSSTAPSALMKSRRSTRQIAKGRRTRLPVHHLRQSSLPADSCLISKRNYFEGF